MTNNKPIIRTLAYDGSWDCQYIFKMYDDAYINFITSKKFRHITEAEETEYYAEINEDEYEFF